MGKKEGKVKSKILYKVIIFIQYKIYKNTSNFLRES